MKKFKNVLSVSVCALVLVFSVSSHSAFKPGSRIEIVPEGAKWLIGHSGESGYSGKIRQATKSFIPRTAAGEYWSERRGGPLGDFIKLWGKGIKIDPAAASDPDEALSAALGFFEDNAGLLPVGVQVDDLEPWTNMIWRGVRFVSFRQTVDGFPVLGTGCFVAMAAGRIVMVGVRAFPAEPITAIPLVTASEAEKISADALGAIGVDVAAYAGPDDVALFPVVDDDYLSFRLVRLVALSSASGGAWTAYVDAEGGELFALKDERMFLSGNVRLMHHDRNPVGALVESAAPYLLVKAGQDTDEDSDYSDTDGGFEMSGGTAPVSTALVDGKYFRVSTVTGVDFSLSDSDFSDSDTLLLQVDDSDSEIEQAQLDAYRFATDVRDHAAKMTDAIAWVNNPNPPVAVRVNAIYQDEEDQVQDYCNAWFTFNDMSMTFLMAGYSAERGGDCYNAAMVADIVYHEYGHGFHLQSIIPGVGYFDEAVGEGFADTMAASILQDSVTGRNFMVDGSIIRDLEPNKVWPDDRSDEPHATGLIVGGALWDLRKALKADLGDVQGNQVADSIFAGAARTTTDVPSIYESSLLADDDNGDLSDGTPHFCSIYEAFAPHGLTSGDLGPVSISHEQISGEIVADQPIEVEADIEKPAMYGDCNTSVGQVRAVYSSNNGKSWSEAAMTLKSGKSYYGEIPGNSKGSELFYRIEAEEGESGDEFVRPTNMAEPYYKAYVGPLREILCDDFEEEDTEWTHAMVEGSDTWDPDDWEWGAPQGKSGDPDAAFSGTHVWGNDLSGNGMYRRHMANTLRSPVWDLSGYDTVRLRFRRWLTVQDGYFDQARIFVNDEEVWSNYVSPGADTDAHVIHHMDGEWVLADVDITEKAAGNSEVQVRWELKADGEGQIGGWNIDDVCLYTADENDTENDAGTGEFDGGPDSGSGTDDGTPDAGGSDDSGLDAGMRFEASGGGCGCATAVSERKTAVGAVVRAIGAAFIDVAL